MIKVGILIPEGEIIVSSIIPVYEIFKGINNYYRSIREHNEDYFEIELIGLTKRVEKYNGSIVFTPTNTIDKVGKLDIIFITTITGDMEKSLKINAPYIPWLIKQYRKYGAELASFCSGAFLLAETGLCDGKSISTHWVVADLFKERYPGVKLTPEAVITDQDGIYSSGGAFSLLNLILYIIEKYCGRDIAIWCSKMYEIDFDRINQNQFVIFNGQKEHTDSEIKNAQIFIEKNYPDRILVDQLAKTFAISRRNFIRRFKKATDNTPTEYIQRVKVEAAKKRFEAYTESISEVMYKIGYSDSKAFRTIFKKYTGLSPIDYKRKYNKSMAK
ncbi:MAG: AraC family transcriptional regulator [Desulfobacterales bacterium SG8_35_2]|nr:MAG: AraC family transcriptional regulator [Desulfobacterales bacterium SG8_35_2]